MYDFCLLYKLIINFLTVFFPLKPKTALCLSTELGICQSSLYMVRLRPLGSVLVGAHLHTCPFQNLLLSTSGGVLPWKAQSPGLILLPSFLFSELMSYTASGPQSLSWEHMAGPGCCDLGRAGSWRPLYRLLTCFSLPSTECAEEEGPSSSRV